MKDTSPRLVLAIGAALAMFLLALGVGSGMEKHGFCVSHCERNITVEK